MLREYFVRFGVLAFVTIAITVGFSRGAEPPPLDISSEALRALGTEEIKQIDEHIEYWKDLIVEAAKGDDVIADCKGILSAYQRYTSTGYQYTFARRAVEILTPLLVDGLKEDDKLLLLKEVNVALCLSKMSQVTIQPALNVMVAHRNPGVRYLGYDGYRAARAQILGQTSEYVKRMFDALNAAAAKENSPPAIGAICQLANISEFTAESVSGFEMRRVQEQMFDILQANWSRWCKRVMLGDIEMTRALEKGIQTIKTLSPAGEDDKAAKGKAMQLLVDLARCASIAYDEANCEGDIADENKIVLRNCETALEDISGESNDYLIRPLTDKNVPARGAAVKSAVLKWVDALSEFGVVKPAFEVTTTRPTTEITAPAAE
ncbi:MAG: hypothetical protein ACYSTL_00955 [Planctomycetota bacterium]|jgi:hypothetical protein